MENTKISKIRFFGDMLQSATPGNEFDKQIQKAMCRECRKSSKIYENHLKSIIPPLWKRNQVFLDFAFRDNFF